MSNLLVQNFPQDPNAHPVPYVTGSSGLLTSDQSVVVGPGILVAVIVYTDGVNDNSVIVYDHADSASGTVLAQVKLAGEDLMGGETNIMGEFTNGLYIDVTGTGVEVLLRYIQ